MNLRKLNRVTHRDLGYLFFGMSVIYGLSGIALNHIKDWNPNFSVETKTIQSDLKAGVSDFSTNDIQMFLSSLGEDITYKKHYFPQPGQLKIFIPNGTVLVNTQTGEAQLEKLTRRPVLQQFNWLHYNSARHAWMWFSDLFAVSLIILAITGLFMIKGKKGITGRGAWLTALGIIIPFILFLMYY